MGKIDADIDPSPYIKHIRAAEFEYGRLIAFDVRDVGADRKQLEPGECDYVEAMSLGQEWDPAIQEYWRRCNEAIEWDRREEDLRQHDLWRKRVFGVFEVPRLPSLL